MESALTPQEKKALIKANIYNSYRPLDNDFEKAKAAPIGTISSKTGLEKVSEGKWVKVTGDKENNTDHKSVNEPVIGKTKSGKTVYNNLTADHSVYSDFTSQDHSEASALHYGQLAHDNYESNTGFQQGALHNSIAKTHSKVADKLIASEIKAAREAKRK